MHSKMSRNPTLLLTHKTMRTSVRVSSTPLGGARTPAQLTVLARAQTEKKIVKGDVRLNSTTLPGMMTNMERSGEYMKLMCIVWWSWEGDGKWRTLDL